MYSASTQFHSAVKASKPQKALLVFSNAIFDDSDIDVSVGIEMDEYFNAEEDICIGQALSNEIRFTLFNDDRSLNNYAFGEFKALLGVQTQESTYVQTGNVTLITGSATFIGRSTPPYLTRNGVDVHCSFPIHSMIDYKGIVLAFNQDGRTTAFTEGGAETVASVNAFMRSKGVRMAGTGMYYNQSTMKMILCHDGVHEVYEFVPLGVFIAKRPNAPDQIRIDMTCYDRMQNFDEDLDMEFSYPTTAGSIVTQMCSHLGVPFKSSTFTINKDVELTEKPKDFENCTYRDILKWAAEVGCSNARFDRDGDLIMDWLHDTSQSMDEGDYVEFNPYWYTTGTVGRLVNRTTDNGIDVDVGTGETYLLQDNPFLRAVNADAKDEKVRQTKQDAYEKRSRKIQYCFDENGNIKYDKLNYMGEDENKWPDESAEWDSTHPD